uniref:Uncharacterized protein n=1 Tax=Rangifer tarandus platyrhynchus TaxID=3082113 RepID=A0ACB0F7E9_RANTA|nr:unnamed protein product [Rangifer tarandus platyrhynchus]
MTGRGHVGAGRLLLHGRRLGPEHGSFLSSPCRARRLSPGQLVLSRSSLSGRLLGGQCGLGRVVTAAESAFDATGVAGALVAESPPAMLLMCAVVTLQVLFPKHP